MDWQKPRISPPKRKWGQFGGPEKIRPCSECANPRENGSGAAHAQVSKGRQRKTRAIYAQESACNADCLYKIDQVRQELLMKTIRHTVNVPSEMKELLNERIRDFRSLSGYFVSLAFTDLLYLPKRPIAKAFANASWQQQRRAIENIGALRKHGWRGVNLQLHFDAINEVEKVAAKCLQKNDWLLDHIEEELAFMRGADLRR